MTHSPTKVCPHRFCHGLHAGIIAASVVLLLTSPVKWQMVLGFIWLLSEAYRIWRYGFRAWARTFGNTRRHHRDQYLQVRRGYARAAVAADTLCVIWLAMSASLNFRDADPGPMRILPILVASLVALAYAGWLVWLHYMATKPAKPKRVRVPTWVAQLGANA